MATATRTPSAAPSRPRLVSRTLMLVFLADFAGLTSFYLLLSVVPQYAASAGAGGAGAGLTTAVLMGATVAAEFAMPRLVAMFGHRTVLAAGLALLGVPALVLPLVPDPAAIVAACVLRGVGLAVIFVVCGELAAGLVPAERRGEGLGVIGVVAGVPAVLAMPVGVWLAGRVGFGPVLVAGAAAGLAGLVAVAALPAVTLPVGDGPQLGWLAALRERALVRPAAAFAATAVGAGAVMTFLPVAVPAGSGGLAAGALLVLSVAATGSRWWAGRRADRQGTAALLGWGVLVAAAGLLGLAMLGSPAVVLAGAALFGVGFGIVQNASLVAMYNANIVGGFGVVTALWSVAYDAGLGAGAGAFGVLSGQTGFAAGFAVTAAVVAAALPFSGLGRRRAA